MPRPKTQPLETARRRRRVVELRQRGDTWASIAETVRAEYGADALPSGWDRRYAHKDFRRLLQKLREEAQEAARDVRDLELRRLDTMQRALWADATGAEGRAADVRAVDRVLKIMDRRTKLLGLDEPQRFRVEGTGGGPVQTFEWASIQWSELSDEQVQRLADGEDPANVIG